MRQRRREPWPSIHSNLTDVSTALDRIIIMHNYCILRVLFAILINIEHLGQGSHRIYTLNAIKERATWPRCQILCASGLMSPFQSCRIEEMRKAEAGHSSDKARVLEELEEARERLDAERAAQRLASERVEATTREVELLRADLAATKQNLDKAEADKTRVCNTPSRVGMDS